jgi:hypothetical protein
MKQRGIRESGFAAKSKNLTAKAQRAAKVFSADNY